MFRLRSLASKFYELCYFALYGGVVFARYKGVDVGSSCRIYIRSWGSEPFLIRIGNKVTITSGVRFLTHDGATWLIHDDRGSRFQKYGRISIGDNVFVGVNSLLMPGITVGARSVVAAGSVVTKDVPTGSVVAGNPAKVIMSFDDYSAKVKSLCVCDSDIGKDLPYEDRVEKFLDLQENQ